MNIVYRVRMSYTVNVVYRVMPTIFALKKWHEEGPRGLPVDHSPRELDVSLLLVTRVMHIRMRDTNFV